MKLKFLLTSIILSFFTTCIPLISVEKSNLKKGFLINVNGISIYKSKENLKEKAGILNYGEEVYLSLSKNENWIYLEAKNFFGFLRGSHLSDDDFLIFSKPNIVFWGILKEETSFLLAKPLDDSEKILEMPQFSIVELISYSHSYLAESPTVIDGKWFEVKAKENKKGFIKKGLEIYSNRAEAELAAKNKKIQVNGYLLIGANPVYLKDPESKEEDNQIQGRGFSKEGEFMKAVQSLEINGQKYFKVFMDNPAKFYKMQIDPKNFNDTPVSGWISEKQTSYFSNQKFSEYTIKKSSFKADKTLLQSILEQNKDLPLNFTEFSLTQLPSQDSSLKGKFYIAKLLEGYTNSARFGNENSVLFIIKEENKNFFSYSGNLSNRGKIDMYDLDGDGIPEFLTKMATDNLSRVAFTAPAFYGYVKGVYKQIPLPGNFLDSYEIIKNVLYLDKRNEANFKTIRIKYKYRNGQFYEIKK